MIAEPFVGNVVHDLGWGAYLWADVIIGGLDNREARVAINSSALFAGKYWVDGAIEVLNGVARVFSPNQGACYECTMNATDWKMLESRRSCALLTRSQMQEGKVPTTPTIASLIAAMQVQETIKILHEMEVFEGKGFVFNGTSSDAYLVQYPRKEDCPAHECSGRIVRLSQGVADIQIGQLLAMAAKELGEGTVLELRRDLIAALTCPSCGNREEIFRSLGAVTEQDGKCPICTQMRVPELIHTLGLEPGLENKTFAQVGVPPFDGITARKGEATVTYVFNGDAKKVLRNLFEESQ
jgi:adenylyltransferase/sulfurtransferase